MKRLLSITLTVVMLALTCIPSVAFAKDELENTDPLKYVLDIDLNNQIVHVYEKDENGEYTKVVRRMLCTTGSETPDNPSDPEDVGTPTPTGVWKAGGRERFGDFAAFSGEFARYWTQIVEDVFFHSVMFSRLDIDYLKSSAWRNLGNKASHGCVRMYVEDAKWIYYNVPEGTTINVTKEYDSTPELRAALKLDMDFSDYDEFQKTIYDNPELPNDKAWVVVEDAPLKSGAGLSSGTRSRLPLGAEVEILQESITWLKVRYEDTEGYVLRGHVSKEQDTLDTSEDMTVIDLTCWLYSDPSMDREFRTFKVPTHTPVTVLETDEEEGIVKIDYLGSVGWVRSGDITNNWGLILD